MQTSKRMMFQRTALLLVAALALQGCKPDTTPDPFTFASQSKVSPDSLVESEAVTITGINLPTKVSIKGGEYSIDGDAYVCSGPRGTIYCFVPPSMAM